MSLQQLDKHLNAGLAEELNGFDYTADAHVRAQFVAQLQQVIATLDKSHWPAPAHATGLSLDYTIKPEIRNTLLALGQSAEKQIDVGE
jgi:hypothetical protein